MHQPTPDQRSPVSAEAEAEAPGKLKECTAFEVAPEDPAEIADDVVDAEGGKKSPHSLNYAAIGALCFGMLTQAYLVISCFPYSGFMAMELIQSVNEDNAGSYAGLLASSFNFGRVLTAYGWGRAADAYGRKSVLMLSLGLSSFFSVLFGLSPSFGLAMALRFSLGMSNAIVGTNKTLVSDLAHGDERLETRAMTMVLGMWAWGFLVAPYVSGMLAEPIKQYPDVDWDSHTFARPALKNFPFLLPNLLGALMCLVAILMCHFFIEEPLPPEKRRNITEIFGDLFKEIMSYVQRRKRYQSLPVTGDSEIEPSNEERRTLSRNAGQEPESGVTMKAVWSKPITRTTLLLYWGNSFLALATDEMFPLFCLSITAGFALPERTIGQILSCSGLIFALSQYFVQTAIYDRFGCFGAVRIGATATAPTILLIPIALLLNGSSDDGNLSLLAFSYLSIVLALNKTALLVFFTNISVAINHTVDADHRAALNGLSIVGSSFAKGLGPTFAGVATTVSVSLFHQYGSVSMFGSMGLVAALVAVSCHAYLWKDNGQPDCDDDTHSLADESAPSVEMLVKKSASPANSQDTARCS